MLGEARYRPGGLQNRSRSAASHTGGKQKRAGVATLKNGAGRQPRVRERRETSGGVSGLKGRERENVQAVATVGKLRGRGEKVGAESRESAGDGDAPYASDCGAVRQTTWANGRCLSHRSRGERKPVRSTGHRNQQRGRPGKGSWQRCGA